MKYYILASIIFLSASCQQNNAKSADETPEAAQTVAATEEKVPVWETWGDVGNISGPMTIEGSFNPPANDGKYVYLFETEGKDNYKLDSVKISGGKFSFSGAYPIGIYRIGFDPKKTGDVILNPNEGKVSVVIRGANFERGMAVSGSQDNTAWQQYVASEAQFQGQLRSLRQQRGKAANKDEFDAQIYAKDDERVASHMNLANQYPGTFSAKILHRIRSAEHRSKGRYWEDIDFTDLSYIKSNLISDRIQDFMRAHSGGTEDGFLNCIDILMAKAKADEKMFEFCLYTVLEGFYSSGMDNICNYILNDYYFGDACGDIELSDYSLVKASRIQNLQIGNTPPDFSMTTLKGKRYHLHEEMKKNKYTLVFFWSSWCHTCEGEIPQLMGIYSANKSKGFEVVGVSVDTDDTAWKNAVNSRNVPWPNVSQLQGWESPVAKDYRVSKTPNMFLLDSEGRIVLKPTTASQIAQYLNANLK